MLEHTLRDEEMMTTYRRISNEAYARAADNQRFHKANGKLKCYCADEGVGSVQLSLSLTIGITKEVVLTDDMYVSDLRTNFFCRSSNKKRIQCKLLIMLVKYRKPETIFGFGKLRRKLDCIKKLGPCWG